MLWLSAQSQKCPNVDLDKTVIYFALYSPFLTPKVFPMGMNYTHPSTFPCIIVWLTLNTALFQAVFCSYPSAILLVFQSVPILHVKLILVVDLSCSFQIVNILKQFTIDGWWMNSRQRKQVGVTIARLGNSGDLKLSACISLWLKRKWNIYILFWLIYTGFKASLDQRGNLTLVKHLLPSIASTNLLLQNSPLLMEGKNRRKIQL